MKRPTVLQAKVPRWFINKTADRSMFVQIFMKASSDADAAAEVAAAAAIHSSIISAASI